MKRGHSHRPSDAFRIATQIVLRFMGISVRLVQKFIYERKMGFVWKHSRQSPPVFSTRSRCRHCVCVDALATWLISSNTVTACRRLSDSPTHLLFSVDGSIQIRLRIRHVVSGPYFALPVTQRPLWAGLRRGCVSSHANSTTRPDTNMAPAVNQKPASMPPNSAATAPSSNAPMP